MRKADYAALAEIISTQIAYAEQRIQDSACGSSTNEYWRGFARALKDTGRDFSNRASVDKAAFLKACGIE